jgi:anaerobic selenocysteine-containing dehydrogenase
VRTTNTVDLKDWEQADAIWLLGDNAATNAPRMLTWLAEADRRGAQLVHITTRMASTTTALPSSRLPAEMRAHCPGKH